ncbi:hypothetical protein [Pseudomonas sp. dw_358]|uniref:hypothetical protein n=1 Tax=Pseudomonas sp. dw_358 TaxID=2720083 RepID=UPI001BD53FEC|nr:hypothetical protein [Pseudomonas sp. dw_358]
MADVKTGKNLKKDPESEGWVLGWGVLQDSPWLLVGVYATAAEAAAEAKKHGNGFRVLEGSYELGTQNFIFFGE